MPQTRGTRKLSPAGAVVMASVFALAGGTILALALGWIPIDPAKLEAPRWVIACAGVMFMAGGYAPLGQAFNLPSWVPPLAGLIAAAALASVFNWIAFFPGERHFSGSSSLLGFQLGSGAAGELTGRIVFGLGAVLIDAIVLVGLVRLLRGSKRPDP